MGETITIQKKNEVWFHVECDAGIKYELNDNFQFQVPGYRHTPLFKLGKWDGYIHMFNPLRSLLHVGLLSNLKEFCDAREYELVYKDNPIYGSPEDTSNITREEVIAFVDSLDIHSKGKKLNINDYQYDAVYEGLSQYRKVILSPTGSGKSLIIYCLLRYAQSIGFSSLLICPTTQLVEQLASDFVDYSSTNGWDVEEHVHKIYSGYEKSNQKEIVISTWQSLLRLTAPWFAKFDCVMVDEVHGSKSKSLVDILEKCTEAKMRFGLTGSLDNSATHKLMIQALFGTIIKVATTRSLIDKGHLTDIQISSILLDYSKDTKKLLKNAEYKDEIKFLVSHEKRNKFIRNLVKSLKGNTLVLFNYVETHGEILFNLIADEPLDKQVHFIHGGTDVDDRESIRAAIEQHDNMIVVASVGTTSTGVNFKNLHNIVFASPTKSVIRVLQSIGRGLRNAEGKTHMTLYDIGDKLSDSKRKPNHTYNHFTERLGIYAKEEFEYKLRLVALEK